jgi:hypothetical protein
MTETRQVPLDEHVKSCEALAKRVKLRTMSADDFIETHASGTLRKNKRLGFVWRDQYLEERTAYEFGWAFECLARSRVTFGDAHTESDSKSVTEAGWHIERYLELSIFPEDRFEAKYIHVEDKDGTKREGIGIIVRETSASWVPGGHIVFAIVAELDVTVQRWRPAENPR